DGQDQEVPAAHAGAARRRPRVLALSDTGDPRLMAKSERRRQIEAMALYPVDWLEERSGIVGGLRYFLFRKVPSDSGWAHTLGSATLTAFLVQTITGVILAMYYKPSPDEA